MVPLYNYYSVENNGQTSSVRGKSGATAIMEVKGIRFAVSKRSFAAAINDSITNIVESVDQAVETLLR